VEQEQQPPCRGRSPREDAQAHAGLRGDQCGSRCSLVGDQCAIGADLRAWSARPCARRLQHPCNHPVSAPDFAVAHPLLPL